MREEGKYDNYLLYMFKHKNVFNRVAKCVLVLASFVVGLIMGTGYIAIFSGMTIVLQHDHYYRKFVDLHKSPKQF